MNSNQEDIHVSLLSGDTEIDQKFRNAYMGKVGAIKDITNPCPVVFCVIRPLVDQGVAQELEPIQILKHMVVKMEEIMNDHMQKQYEQTLMPNQGIG